MNTAPHLHPALAVSLLVIFLLLGLRVRLAKDPSERKRSVNILLLYTFGLSALVVGIQRDAWPFTTYILAAPKPSPDREACRFEFRGLDARGGEWHLDPYTFSPQTMLMVQLWFGQDYPALDENEKRRALAFLLHKAEESRRRLSKGENIGPDAWLGRFWSAGSWSRMERHLEVPEVSYQTLLVYRVCWVPAELHDGTGRRVSSLVAKYP